MIFRKKKGTDLPEAAFREATQPVQLSPEAFEYRAGEAIKAYLTAIYSQNISILPQNMVTEAFFYKTRDLIIESRKRVQMDCRSLSVNGLLYAGYDSNEYSIRSLTFEASFEVYGIYADVGGKETPYFDSGKGSFLFINDARLGFILAGHTIIKG